MTPEIRHHFHHVIQGAEGRINIALWIVQIILAAIYAMAGVMKSTKPKDQLSEKLPWVEDFRPSTVKIIGIAELFAAAGLISPPPPASRPS